MATITPNDIKLLASARMVDTTDGGGQMVGSALQDGAENNLFPDVSSTDRAFGRLALRKVYAAVLNTGTDALLGAHVVLDDMPDDAAVTAWALQATGQNESRAEVLARLEQSHWDALGPLGLTWAGTPYSRTRLRSDGGVVPLSVGSVVFTVDGTGTYGSPVLITGLTEVLSSDGTYSTGFPSMNSGDRVFAVTYEGTVPSTYNLAARLGVPSVTAPRVVSTRPISGTLAIGDTYCSLDTLLAQIVPKNPGAAAGSAAQIGINAAAIPAGGAAAAFRGGDGLVVHHTAEVSAAIYANGNTVNCGRTNLASVRLIGADGLGIYSGWSANLATGIVTVTSISGWSQPVRVRHTIEEVLGCSRTGYPEVSGGSAGTGVSEATAPFTLSAGLTMYGGRPNVGALRVLSKTGQDISNLTYSYASGPTFVSGVRVFNIDLAAGTATFASTDVAALIASHSPVTLTVSGTYSALSTASAAQSTLNRVTFNRALTRAFPSGSMLSSMLFVGDLQAGAGQSFEQETWGQVWADTRIGPVIAPQYNQAGHPIAVNNAGALTERWAITFLTSTTFRVVGETLGQIATGDVNTALAPTNPATGQPYFTLAAAGWGSGWSGGNVLRFNTRGANAGVWVARATLPSAPSSTPDSLTVAIRGDIDA